MKLRLSILVAALAFISVEASANGLFENERYAIHPKFAANYNIHSSDFRSFQGSADCGLFKSGSGFGMSGLLGFERIISPKSFLGIGFGIFNRSGDLKVSNTLPARDLINDRIVDVKADNVLSSSLSYFEIQPDFRYILSENFINGPLRAVGALRFYFPISSSFEQREEIVSPSGAVFVNAGDARTKKREIASGDIRNINTFGYGISAGLENMLKVGQRSFFTQQIMFDLNLQDVASDAKWKIYSVRLDLGFRYSMLEKPAEIPVMDPAPPPPPPVEIIVEEVPPAPSFNIIPGNFSGSLNTGNELLATVPLVNSVFFERNKSKLSDAYKFSAVSEEMFFDEDAVGLHNYVLPRIAMIIKNNPKGSIVLESSTSGSPNEPAGIDLARARAEEVKSKLVELGVESSKISITPRVTPRVPSNQDFPEGIDENQRVDIIVRNAPLQEYVDIQKFRELRGDLKVAVDFQNYPKDTKANLAGSIGSNIIDISSPGEYTLPAKQRIDEQIAEHQFELLFNIDGETHIERGKIDLTKLPINVVELNLDNFEAILRFDYNSSVLSEDNKALLRQLADKLPHGAIVRILGSADALGSEERNIVLSRERAANTEQFIKSIAGNKFIIETGINNDKFNEDTPQGRFLNRSIRIKVSQNK